MVRSFGKKKIAASAPDDAHSLVAVPGYLIVACSVAERATADSRNGRNGNSDLVAVGPEDGHVIWKYSLYNRSGQIGYNEMPAVVDGAVIFNDKAGGAYSVALEDGRENWYTRHAGADEQSFSTAGGAVVGPDGRAYVVSNSAPNGKGQLRVHDLRSGAVLWTQDFDEQVNAGVAVGLVRGSLAVIVAVGDNVACFPTIPGQSDPMSHAQVIAIDTKSQQKLWDFHLPAYNKACAGVSWGDMCCPDVFGNPTIDQDGHVYLNWSGG